MRGVAAFAALLAANLLATPTQARMHAGPNQLSAGHRLQGQIAPLDGGGAFSAPAAAYSLRRLRSAYTGPAIRIRRASDNAEQDINFLGFTGFTGAPIDTAAAAAFCAATSCFIVKRYDQSGSARDAAQPTAGLQPALLFNCLGSLPCGRTTAAQNLASASVTPATGKGSFSAVANWQSGTGSCYWITSNGFNALVGVPSGFIVTDAVTNLVGVSADGVWHAVVGLLNGASSVIRIDATETTGISVAGNVTAGPIYMPYGSATATCDETEGIVWDNYFLTAAERAALTANQKSFWGTP